MELLIEPFAANPFMQRALVASLLTVVTTSLIGTWVVLRGMSFVGDAMAHGVIPGIALAYLFGINLGIGAGIAALVMAGGIDVVGRRSRLGQDTAIGLLFVGMLALGVMLISLRGEYAGELTAILFGDAIGVTSGDVIVTGIAAGIALVVAILLYRPFVVLAFSHDKAAVLGLRPGLTHLAMLALVGLAIVVSFRTVGTLLVFAFLVAPPAAASLVARRVPAMMAVAVVFGSAAVYLGLLMSFHLATPASASIAVVAVVEFFVVVIAQAGRDAVVQRRVRLGTV